MSDEVEVEVEIEIEESRMCMFRVLFKNLILLLKP